MHLRLLCSHKHHLKYILSSILSIPNTKVFGIFLFNGKSDAPDKLDGKDQILSVVPFIAKNGFPLLLLLPLLLEHVQHFLRHRDGTDLAVFQRAEMEFLLTLCSVVLHLSHIGNRKLKTRHRSTCFLQICTQREEYKEQLSSVCKLHW